MICGQGLEENRPPALVFQVGYQTPVGHPRLKLTYQKRTAITTRTSVPLNTIVISDEGAENQIISEKLYLEQLPSIIILRLGQHKIKKLRTKTLGSNSKTLSLYIYKEPASRSLEQPL